MPLEILGPLVLLGIISAVIFVRFVANTPPRLIKDIEQARSILLRDFPSITFGPDVLITQNKREAIIEIDQPVGHIGLLHGMGSKHVARLLHKDDIKKVSKKGENLLVVHLNELTLPKVEMAFNTSKQKDAAIALLNAI